MHLRPGQHAPHCHFEFRDKPVIPAGSIHFPYVCIRPCRRHALVHSQENRIMNLPSPGHASPRFKLGRIFATPAALEVIADARVSIVDLLIRHIRGDWGDLSEPDRQQNELSIDAELRLLSSYVLPGGHTVLVITEWDRSSTTFLLPGDY